MKNTNKKRRHLRSWVKNLIKGTITFIIGVFIVIGMIALLFFAHSQRIDYYNEMRISQID